MKSFKMNLKSILATAALSMIVGSQAFGQNLVENGSFEATTGKTKKLGQIDMATGWKSPTGARADLFINNAKTPEINTAGNTYGKEEAPEGKNYAGVVAYGPKGKASRSYIMAKLKTPLKKDMKYCVSFKISLADGSKYACNNIGAMLDKKERGSDAKTSIIEEKTSVLSMNNKVNNAIFGWQTVCNTFTADGGEKFIVIGNFTPDDPTKLKTETMKMDKDNKFAVFAGAYYYIDDVVVTLLEDGQKCDCDNEDKMENVGSTIIYQKQVANGDKMKPVDRIQAQGLFFAFGKIELTTQAKASLDIIAADMKANPNFSIVLAGHGDVKEDELAMKKEFYKNLDQKRADAIKAYLVSKGVDASKISIETKGSSTPNEKEYKPEDDEELKMAKNRRVDVMVKM